MIMQGYDDVHIPYSRCSKHPFSRKIFKHLPNGIIHRSWFSFTLCPYTLVHNVHVMDPDVRKII